MSSFARHVYRLVALAALSLGLALASVAPASAARHALVIGNDAYASVRPLVNAVNDAESIAAALETVGYEVIVGRNANRLEMTVLLSRLTKSLEPGDEVVFYYAGHGVELRGRNLLLPVDFPPLTSSDELVVEASAIELDFVLRVLNDSKARVRIVILDACRDNPLEAANGRSVGGARGLAAVAPVEGTVVMYSAGAGQKALDTDGTSNSIFASSLIPLIQTRGLSLIDLARQVRRDVETAALKANHEQRPAYYEDVTDDYYFLGGPEDQPVVPPPENPPPNQGGPNSTAVACDESGSLYYDDFATRDDTWGNPRRAVFEGGRMQVTTGVNDGYLARNLSGPYEEFDACIDVVQHIEGDGDSAASLVFWAKDNDNFYMLEVKPDGRVRVLRRQNAKWIVPVSAIQTRSLVRPVEQSNRLRVVARGNIAALYVNDRFVTQFRGSPPEGGGYIGIHVQPPTDSAATFEYDNLVISPPSSDFAITDWVSPVRSGAALDCRGSTELYHDDFAVADPAWGSADELNFAGGLLSMTVASQGFRTFNRAGLYDGDLEVCFDLVQHNDDPQSGWASVLFWGVDSDNFYTFNVSTNGYVRFARYNAGTWEHPVDWKLTENLVKAGEGNNRLRLVLRGNTATGYVNGQQVLEFTGERPTGGTYVGIFGDAPKTGPATFDFDNFTVTTAEVN